LAAGLLLMLMCVSTFGTAGELLFSTGHVTSEEYLSDTGFMSRPFEVPKGSHICSLSAKTSRLDNAWVGLTVAFLDKDDNVVLDADSIVEYYHGVEGGERWSEGSLEDETLMLLDGPKEYRVNIFGETGVWSRTGGDRTTTTGAPVSIAIYRGMKPARYFFFAAIIALVYPLWEFGRGVLFESRRWPSDDDD
jgi:hypothetical protein